MFKSLATHLLQHIIAQNAWANDLLRPFAGRCVKFNIVPLRASVVILENGSLAIAGNTHVADASIIIPPSLLLRLIAKDEAAKLQIRIEGNTSLASALAKVLSNMQWDFEEDLSKLIGDVPAYSLTSLAQRTTHVVKQSGHNIASMLSEYWQEENPLITKQRYVEQFIHDVDVLRADTERFEKKINKLLMQSNIKSVASSE